METTGTLEEISIDYKTNKPKISFLINDKSKLPTIEELKGIKLKIIAKKDTKNRSNNANAYFHLLVNQLARYFNISDEEMKIKMNLDYGTIARFEDGRIKGCKVPKETNMKEIYKYSKWYKTDDDGYDCYIFYKETHTLNTKEMSQLINGVVQECDDIGIERKTPAEIKSLLESWDKK